MKFSKIITLLLLISSIVACKKTGNEVEKPQGGAFVEDLYSNLTASIVRDQFSPPVAARAYAYAYIAAYEAAVPFNSGYESYAGQLTDLKSLPKAENIEELDSNLVVLSAFATVSFDLTFKNQSFLKEFQQKNIDKYTPILGKEKVDKSIAYGKAIGDAIIAWTKTDNYVEVRNYPKYKANVNSRENWLPTYPNYAEALCPAWNQLRPLVLDSATQFLIDPPTQFDSTEGSPFYEENMVTYNVSKEVDSTKKFIAYFWDDNPSVTEHRGHLGFNELKLTPGGHWMGIAAAACRRESKSLIESLRIQSLAAIAIFDGFIVCWDEKFRSDYIRPITYISRYIERDWKSFLQTPNFPEYPSGHSVVSGSASSVLESAFGTSYSFTDSTEMEYLHGARAFNSFSAAADEAAMSRMYGGIHFMPAIENGIDMGRNVGGLVLKKIK